MLWHPWCLVEGGWLQHPRGKEKRILPHPENRLAAHRALLSEPLVGYMVRVGTMASFGLRAGPKPLLLKKDGNLDAAFPSLGCWFQESARHSGEFQEIVERHGDIHCANVCRLRLTVPPENPVPQQSEKKVERKEQGVKLLSREWEWPGFSRRTPADEQE
ncbi:hypothetical protein P7K49_016951 [Saguinus oedipus]|uniref:Uncharacterized protein n=1 Tax=Saguinus oedipus TaxID=9490 RepID=A0ABQ9V267_SAGOE|nr:hypothetical protein P7K49_016951 [Saguinus oedipus]